MPNLKPNLGAEFGSANDPEVRKLLAAVIKKCSKSREEIAEAMSVYAGQPISKSMLNDWTAESKSSARFPAFLIESFCEATGDDTLQRWAIGPRLRRFLELGERAAEIIVKTESNGKRPKRELGHTLDEAAELLRIHPVEVRRRVRPGDKDFLVSRLEG